MKTVRSTGSSWFRSIINVEHTKIEGAQAEGGYQTGWARADDQYLGLPMFLHATVGFLVDKRDTGLEW